MAIGFAIDADANLYLILGIPLTLAFQVFVGRRRLEDLWVRDGRPFDRHWVIVVGTTAGVAAAVSLLLSRTNAGPALWSIAAAIGVLGAVYALRQRTPAVDSQLVRCLAIGGGIGVLFVVVSAVSGGISRRATPDRVAIGIAYVLLYFAVSFALEEVSFRGALDSHLHGPGDPHSFASAVFVSALWGMWHLPIIDGPLVAAIPQLLIVHVPLGVVLSIYWRRSGNLAVVAAPHAFVDAVRNAVLG